MAQLTLFHNISSLLTMAGAAKKQGRKIAEVDLGLTEKAAILAQNGRVVWAGREKLLPKSLVPKTSKLKKVDLGGATVLPAFTECHTHRVFAGDSPIEAMVRSPDALDG